MFVMFENPRYQLIGLQARTVESRDPALKGLKGVIVDETRNTLSLKVDGKVKMIPKQIVTLCVICAGQEHKVEGREVLGRPEERLQRRLKKGR